MSNYDRRTRECFVSQLHPELRQAIREYFKEHNLGDPETESLICCETISEKKDAGKLVSWLGGESDSTIYTGMLLTSQKLIWVRKGDQSDIVLNAANLKEMRVNAYEPLLSKEPGLEILGFIETTKSRVRGHIGMGPEAATQKFGKAVQETIAKLKPPSKKRGLFKWLLG
jgi:L-fucose isomerase-like protein